MAPDILPQNFLTWPLDLTIEIWRRALNLDPDLAPAREEPHWATRNRVALELAELRLRCFADCAEQTAAVVVAPYALHDAQLADLAPGHSLIEALLRHDCRHLWLVEWKSAADETRLNTIDSQLAALNVVVDDIGGPVDLVGLCQGGWLSLIFAVRFPRKIRRLVLVGCPVDFKSEPSALSHRADATPDEVIEHLIRRGRGLVLGRDMAGLWPREASEETRLAEALQLTPPFSGDAEKTAVAEFQRWDRRPIDLPGPYYREVIKKLYRENLLARGAFSALGKAIGRHELDRAAFLLVGERDGIAPPAQAFAAEAIVAGKVEKALAPCGHLALFMGRRTLAESWPRIARWLRA